MGWAWPSPQTLDHSHLRGTEQKYASYRILVSKPETGNYRRRRMSVWKVYATDRDAGDNARIDYELRRDPSGFFTIDSHTGWVTVARPMTGVTFYVVTSNTGNK